VSGGGIIGQVIGTYFVILPNPYPRILFTVVAACFGTALLLSRFKLKHTPRQTLPVENRRQRITFFLIGIFGGAFAAHTGSGIDMLTFIVLTLAYGIHEKVSTPTTVVIMGLNSIVGFALHGLVSQDIGVVWEYWLVAVPVVVIGAPMGAMLAARLHRDVIIVVLAGLIALEVFTTLWLVPFNTQSQLVTLLVMPGCAFIFALMLRHRRWLYHRS
ncbi:MAG: TSUP family transporter, partial [Aggregatilineales bacterium]